MRRKVKKQRKRKYWPGHKYWSEYLVQNCDLWIDDQPTINHSLAKYLLKGETFPTKEAKIEAIEQCVRERHLASGRLEAIKRLREADVEIFIVGEGHIEGITKDEQFREESLRRLARQKAQKDIATFKATITHHPTDEQIKEWGLPKPREIALARKRLLLGDAETEVKVK